MPTRAIFLNIEVGKLIMVEELTVWSAFVPQSSRLSMLFKRNIEKNPVNFFTAVKLSGKKFDRDDITEDKKRPIR
jgi:hypothetical protein